MPKRSHADKLFCRDEIKMDYNKKIMLCFLARFYIRPEILMLKKNQDLVPGGKAVQTIQYTYIFLQSNNTTFFITANIIFMDENTRQKVIQYFRDIRMVKQSCLFNKQRDHQNMSTTYRMNGCIAPPIKKPMLVHAILHNRHYY